MKRERKIPSRSYLLSNEATEVKRLINSINILEELSKTEQSISFEDGGYGKEIIKETLVSLIKKDMINANNIADCMLLMSRLSLSYIIDVVNLIDNNIESFEYNLNKYLADKELYVYEENYLLSDECPIIKSRLINETLEKKKSLILAERHIRKKEENTIFKTHDNFNQIERKSIYDSEYYNNGLDIDQQDQDFWEDIL